MTLRIEHHDPLTCGVNEKTTCSVAQEYRTLLDGIPDAIVRISPELKILWTNQAAGRLLDALSNPLEGRHCFEVWHNRSSPCEVCPVQRCFAKGEPQEEIIRTGSGRIFGVKAFPLFDGEGKVASVIEVNSDITEKLRLREESIHQSRLAALGELAAGVAHEINNPNALILLNAPVLQEVSEQMLALLEEKFHRDGDFLLGRLPYSRMRSELPRLHTGVVEAAGRIRRIVEDLKGFAREGGRECEETTDLNAAVETALRLTDHYLQKSTLRFGTDLAGNLPQIRGNPQRIEQVVVNLLMNACQALPEKDRGIFLQSRFNGEEGFVEIIVRDEGVGIPSENLARVMEPFFTTRRNDGGTGLGLSVSANIVKEYGGTIRIDSQPGHGTAVTISFPAAVRTR